MARLWAHTLPNFRLFFIVALLMLVCFRPLVVAIPHSNPSIHCAWRVVVHALDKANSLTWVTGSFSRGLELQEIHS